MKFLLTGASGFIGRNLSRRLLSAGNEAHAIIRPQTDVARLVPGVTAHLFRGEANELCDIVARVNPDLVFHLATRFQDRHTPADIEPLIADNIAFGAILAESMAQADIRYLVNVGTSWQHYMDAEYSPTCFYAATKEALEAILRFYVDVRSLKVITLKLFDSYGPGDTRGKLLSRFAQMAEDGSSLDMSPGEQLIDLVNVEDITSAFLTAADRLISGEAMGWESYAVSSGHPIMLRDLAQLFAKHACKPLHINWGARPYREHEIMAPWSNGTQLPGWQPQISLDEGLKRLLANHV